MKRQWACCRTCRTHVRTPDKRRITSLFQRARRHLCRALRETTPNSGNSPQRSCPRQSRVRSRTRSSPNFKGSSLSRSLSHQSQKVQPSKPPSSSFKRHNLNYLSQRKRDSSGATKETQHKRSHLTYLSCSRPLVYVFKRSKRTT